MKRNVLLIRMLTLRIVWPDPGVAADVEEAIRAAASVAIDVGAGPHREWNSAADEDARAEVMSASRARTCARAGLERALEDPLNTKLCRMSKVDNDRSVESREGKGGAKAELKSV